MKRLLGYGILVAWLTPLYLVVPSIWVREADNWAAVVFALVFVVVGASIGWSIASILQGRQIVAAGFVSLGLYIFFRAVGDYGFLAMLYQDLQAGQVVEHLSEIATKSPAALASALFFNLVVPIWMFCAAMILLLLDFRDRSGALK